MLDDVQKREIFEKVKKKCDDGNHDLVDYINEAIRLTEEHYEILQKNQSKSSEYGGSKMKDKDKIKGMVEGIPKRDRKQQSKNL